MRHLPTFFAALCLVLLLQGGVLATNAFAMSEAEFKQRCIASGGTYQGPANDSGLAYPPSTAGPGKCSWKSCHYETVKVRHYPYSWLTIRRVCSYAEQINMQRV